MKVFHEVEPGLSSWSLSLQGADGSCRLNAVDSNSGRLVANKLKEAYEDAVAEFNDYEGEDSETYSYLEGYMLGLRVAIAIIEKEN